MGSSCSTDANGMVIKSKGHGAPSHMRPAKLIAHTSKLGMNRKTLKNPDGSINRPWPVDGGKVRWQGISEESLDLTTDEMDLVVLPAMELLEYNRVMKLCSEDLLLRCTRGYTNNSPDTKRFQACVPNVGNHVAALAEALDRILSCRYQENVQADKLLTRRLESNDKFHEYWPQTMSGIDTHGHYIMCERIANIEFSKIPSIFSLDEFLVHISQRSEAFQLMQTKESMKRVAAGKTRAYKHVHIVDLTGISLMQFMRIKSTLLPVFKHCADQYPNTMWKIFVVNSPGLFSNIWSVLKSVIDPETAAKVNILSTHETAHSEQRFREAGIEKDQLPPWLFEGACGKELPMREVVEAAMAENVYESESPLHDLYYPPINKQLADRLAAGSTLPVAEVKVMKEPRRRSRSRSHKRVNSSSSSSSASMPNPTPSSQSSHSNHHDKQSGLQKLIIVLLVMVLVLLVFIAWHQVTSQNSFSPAPPSSNECPCSCPNP